MLPIDTWNEPCAQGTCVLRIENEMHRVGLHSNLVANSIALFRPKARAAIRGPGMEIDLLPYWRILV